MRGPALDLGADAFFDLDAEDLSTLPPASVVFDTVGGAPLEHAAQQVTPGGTVVSIVDQPAAGTDARGVYFVVEPDRATLVELASAIDAGELRATVGHACALDDAADAILGKQRGELRGKIVIALRD